MGLFPSFSIFSLFCFTQNSYRREATHLCASCLLEKNTSKCDKSSRKSLTYNLCKSIIYKTMIFSNGEEVTEKMNGDGLIAFAVPRSHFAHSAVPFSLYTFKQSFRLWGESLYWKFLGLAFSPLNCSSDGIIVVDTGGEKGRKNFCVTQC